MTEDISEIPDAPRQRKLSFYLVLALLVAPLYAILPLSWLFVFHSLYTGKLWLFHFQGRIAFAMALCEIFSTVYHHNLVKSISHPCPNGPGDLAELQTCLSRVLKSGMADLPENGKDEESWNSERPGSPGERIVQLDYNDPRAIDFRNCLRTWYRRQAWSSITLQDVQHWLHWAIFNAEMPPKDKLAEDRRVVLEEAVDLLQKRSGKKFPENDTRSAVKPLLLTLDTMNVYWRPFFFYAIVGMVNSMLKHMYERFYDLHYKSHEGLDYLVRIPKHWDARTGPRPIVFFHGLGFGMLQYSNVISHMLDEFKDRPLLFILQPNVSQNIFHPRFLKPMGRRETTEKLSGLLRKLGWVKIPKEGDLSDASEDDEVRRGVLGTKGYGVTMISHSNGSYSHAWMLKEHPSMVTRSCFVDPVTFCSWEGDLCWNFVYRPCTNGLELLMRYFVGTELGVANTLQRHFDWSSNSLWYEEIPHARDPSKAMFFVGGKDAIVNAERVKRYLTSHGIKKGLWYDPNGHHGQALMPGGLGRKEILQWLKEDEAP